MFLDDQKKKKNGNMKLKINTCGPKVATKFQK
jgi:hypothetical protein